jgi:hypothetical protein
LYGFDIFEPDIVICYYEGSSLTESSNTFPKRYRPLFDIFLFFVFVGHFNLFGIFYINFFIVSTSSTFNL